MAVAVARGASTPALVLIGERVCQVVEHEVAAHAGDVADDRAERAAGDVAPGLRQRACERLDRAERGELESVPDRVAAQSASFTASAMNMTAMPSIAWYSRWRR